ncbi:MAG: aldehyde dehydrogenase [Saprospiraceae bacterium]|nr:aldehyde dehydrogenase [Saprospiraceae bacterium]
MNPDKYIKNYINGSFSPASSGGYLDTINPAFDTPHAKYPDSGEAEIKDAIAFAKKAAPGWRNIDPETRFRLLMRMADIIEQESVVFAQAETRDTGKPYSMSSSADIPRAQACLRFYATAILHNTITSSKAYRKATQFQVNRPMGVVAIGAHWNYPLLNLCEWIAPALAAGNCVVAHPSDRTPSTAHLLSKAAMEAGLPSGVLNIVHGKDSVIEPLMGELDGIDAVGFSGTYERGRDLAARCAENYRPVLLDTGGKNPAIVLEDADADQTVIGLLRSIFTNNGQSAYSTSRLFIARSRYEEIRDELVKRTQFLRIGDPLSKVTDLGPLISREHLERVLSFVSLAELEGGTIICGGKHPNMSEELENGFFIRPTLVEGLSPDARTNQEEIFGPLATITPFDTEEDVIRMSNQNPYQRSAAIWGRDTRVSSRIASELICGQIWVNDWIQSGRDSGHRLYGYAGNGTIGGYATMRFFNREASITQGF